MKALGLDTDVITFGHESMVQDSAPFRHALYGAHDDAEVVRGECGWSASCAVNIIYETAS